MNEILMYVAIGFGILILALIVPGLKLIAEALLKVFLEGVYSVLRHKGLFLVWVVKTLATDHIRILRHAFTARDTLDPTQKVRRKVEGYES